MRIASKRRQKLPFIMNVVYIYLIGSLIMWISHVPFCLGIKYSKGRIRRRNGQLYENKEAMEQEYILQCNTKLLSNAVVKDFLISQNEFASFLKEFSVSIGNPKKYSSSFFALDISLQLDFVWTICPYWLGINEKRACLNSLLLHNDGDEFGLTVSLDEIEKVKELVKHLCTQSYLHYSYIL